jgi:hypothetical protein
MDSEPIHNPYSSAVERQVEFRALYQRNIREAEQLDDELKASGSMGPVMAIPPLLVVIGVLGFNAHCATVPHRRAV